MAALLLTSSSVTSYAQVTFNIVDFGAAVGNNRNNSRQIQAAIDSASAVGGGTVVVPSGVFFTSTIRLKDNVYVELSQGATLKGVPLSGDYPVINSQTRSYTDRYTQRSLIYAENASNIGIIGQGVLDGNGNSLDFLINSDRKPYGIRFISCQNVKYEDVTLRNSGFWMMHNFNCDSLVIRNIKVINHAFGNNDGISIDGCRNVLVENCTVDANNDPIVIKITSPFTPAENILVRNCQLATYARAIKIGTETQGPVRNVRIENCTVDFSRLGPFGSNFPADNGINLSIVDGGSLDNVVIENVSIKGVRTPITIRLGDRGNSYISGAPRPEVGSFRNVIIRNVDITAREGISSTVSGIPGHSIQNIRFENVEITVAGGQSALPADFIVPENEGAKPDNDVLGNDIPAHGIFFRHIDTLVMENVCVNALRPDGRPEFTIINVENLSNSGCRVATSLIENRNDIALYPNPATNKIHISSTSESMEWIEIVSISGKTLETHRASPTNMQLDVTHLSPGMYFLKIIDTNGGTSVRKWMKQ